DHKYNSAFILNAMSEDEDDPDTIPGRTATQWVSHAPDYHSDTASTYPIVTELYKAIDAISDPNPDKEKAATMRIHGTEIRNAVPLVAKHLENRIRAWKVKSSALEANLHWFTKGRVAHSGILWGNTEDPEENSAPKRKRQSGVAAAGPGTVKCPHGTVHSSTDVEKSKKRLTLILFWREIDCSFLDLLRLH
ncbi:hypothetical protein WOLCODRAFT_83940, partial [Wolfiporia cocos MD-104 SS10]